MAGITIFRLSFTYFWLSLWCASVLCQAQDPIKVDPSHFKVEFENEQIRVLRFRLGPHEKSPMHEHPARVTVNLASGRSRVTLADGRTQEMESKMGEAAWRPAVRHMVENLSDKPLETVSTEFKPPRVIPAKVTPAEKTVTKRKVTVKKKPGAKRAVKKITRSRSSTGRRRTGTRGR